jgi:hypothetical protein
VKPNPYEALKGLTANEAIDKKPFMASIATRYFRSSKSELMQITQVIS